MKTLKYLFAFTLVTMLGFNGMAFSGTADKTETRNVKDFHAVKVSTGVDLYLKMGDTESVKVVADDDIIEDLITEIENGTLNIYMKKSTWGNWGFSKTRKVYVTVKELDKINASSGSDVRSENTLQGESLEVNASSGSNVRLDVVYKNFSLDLSSGSDAKVTGKTKFFEAEASSGSDINAKELESVICKVRVSSGSGATVNVSKELYANASSGGDVNYYGNPQVRDIDESSGGDVSRR